MKEDGDTHENVRRKRGGEGEAADVPACCDREAPLRGWEEAGVPAGEDCGPVPGAGWNCGCARRGVSEAALNLLGTESSTSVPATARMLEPFVSSLGSLESVMSLAVLPLGIATGKEMGPGSTTGNLSQALMSAG